MADGQISTNGKERFFNEFDVERDAIFCVRCEDSTSGNVCHGTVAVFEEHADLHHHSLCVVLQKKKKNIVRRLTNYQA